jgi:hypothetical protein
MLTCISVPPDVVIEKVQSERPDIIDEILKSPLPGKSRDAFINRIIWYNKLAIKFTFDTGEIVCSKNHRLQLSKAEQGKFDELPEIQRYYYHAIIEAKSADRHTNFSARDLILQAWQELPGDIVIFSPKSRKAVEDVVSRTLNKLFETFNLDNKAEGDATTAGTSSIDARMFAKDAEMMQGVEGVGLDVTDDGYDADGEGDMDIARETERDEDFAWAVEAYERMNDAFWALVDRFLKGEQDALDKTRHLVKDWRLTEFIKDPHRKKILEDWCDKEWEPGLKGWIQSNAPNMGNGDAMEE